MNPTTGSVATMDNWVAESATWEGDIKEQLARLVEVVKDEDGDWVDAEDFTPGMIKELSVLMLDGDEERHSGRVEVVMYNGAEFDFGYKYNSISERLFFSDESVFIEHVEKSCKILVQDFEETMDYNIEKIKNLLQQF